MKRADRVPLASLVTEPKASTWPHGSIIGGLPGVASSFETCHVARGSIKGGLSWRRSTQCDAVSGDWEAEPAASGPALCEPLGLWKAMEGHGRCEPQWETGQVKVEW